VRSNLLSLLLSACACEKGEIELEEPNRAGLKLLSVVIPTLNSGDTLNYTLSSLLSNDFERDHYEVIIIDGGSTDNTLGVCRRFPVEVLFCPKKGWSAALNLGAKKARGDIVCITNADVIVPNDWLRKIWEFFRNNPHVEGVGGPILAPRLCRNHIQKFATDIFVEDQGFPVKLIRSQYMKMWGGGLISGPNYAYRRETLLHSGGFNESLMSYSDVDLCWRLVKMGKHLVFNPEIKIIDIGSPSTLRGVFKQQFKWGKGLGELMKIHRVDKVMDDLKAELFSFYQVLRTVLLLFSPTCFPKTKQLLRCINCVSFQLGRIYGRT
jgi:cellulose synthase/poly-beta-1,6-N-acetylglucosamine synthase-like glycosyltransferase